MCHSVLSYLLNHFESFAWVLVAVGQGVMMILALIDA